MFAVCCLLCFVCSFFGVVFVFWSLLFAVGCCGLLWFVVVYVCPLLIVVVCCGLLLCVVCCLLFVVCRFLCCYLLNVFCSVLVVP